MPEQEPPEGHALHSISYSSASVIWPRARLPTASNAVVRSMDVPSASRPAFIGPPETNTVGTSTRSAPITIPGTILSQFGMQTSASSMCAFIIVSMQSAMSSREGRL